MKHTAYLLTSLLMVMGPAQAGQVNTIGQLAEIIISLNQQTTPAQQKILDTISASSESTSNERHLAQALSATDNVVSPDGKEALRFVLRDIGASEAERLLAKVLYRLDGQPSAKDIRRLKKLLH